MMRVVAMIWICILLLASDAQGITQTSAFTRSFFMTGYSDLAAARTISESTVTAPDLSYKSYGQADALVVQPYGGGASISQMIFSGAQNYGGLGGIALFSSNARATNVKSSYLMMKGMSTTEVCNSQDSSKIESQTFGMGIARPAEGDYVFSVDGAQKTESTAMPAVTIIPVFVNDEHPGKELVVTFEQIPAEFEQPADVLEQEVNFNYGSFNNMLTFYGYDFRSRIAVDDTMCSSSMSFQHIN